ncbi:MAG: type II secretion system protein [Microcystis sp. M048S1]|uniref:PulJ/GspJ family protein n=1 Tax=unclassified Microcystis TaxID=2643300 RepID=UPI00258E76FA|nr:MULTISPECIES: type II secretion system protein [unclassified Microcystis]MCA2768205.1 type II secretion system protein [Microcystis sp. M152S2]MCA2777099.1 type II secretion system protein [Microcystis sp. M135S2]MCA2780568.1 type II secretion system protein [Microcystis sp. M136S2]MCA2893422.1 type II secretion system protein [Microcystis sp. M048S1]
MRFFLEYINHLGRLQKKSAHRRLQPGFTITEVLLAGLMMLIAVLMAGNGLINLLRSNYRANADSEIRNNLNRTLEFVSDEVRRARIIAGTEDAITSTKVPPGAKAVLAFRIPDPNNPGQAPLNEQIVYYTTSPGLESSLTGPRVLWRFGPNLDANGNYTTPANVATWQHSPVTDMLAATVNNPNCPTGFIQIPDNLNNVGGFYTCVRTNGNQVILNANAQVQMTTNEVVNYSVSTGVFPRANCEIFCLATPPPPTPPPTPPPSPPPTPPFYRRPGFGATRPTLPIVTVPATVKAEIIKGGTCTFSPSCGVLAAPQQQLVLGQPEGAFGSPVLANAGDGIVVFVNGLRNVYEKTETQTVDVYTSDTGLPPDININPLTNNQILFVFTTKTTPTTSYQILVTIEPQ